MMIEEMVRRGELKLVSCDTYVSRNDADSTERKNPLSNMIYYEQSEFWIIGIISPVLIPT
jgi:hypothetical protein